MIQQVKVTCNNARLSEIFHFSRVKTLTLLPVSRLLLVQMLLVLIARLGVCWLDMGGQYNCWFIFKRRFYICLQSGLRS